MLGTKRHGVHASNEDIGKADMPSLKAIATVIGGREVAHCNIINLSTVMGDGTVTAHCVKGVAKNTEPT